MSMAIKMADASLAREQEYDYHWCYERGIITKSWCDVTEVTGDEKYYLAAKANVDKYIGEDGNIATYEMDKYNLDMINFGRTLLRVYAKNPKRKYKLAADTLLKQLSGQPRTKEGGFWHKEIYPHQMWLDGIFMACPFMVEYARMFDAPEWYAEAHKQMMIIGANAYDEKLGLYLHAWDSAHVQKWADPNTGLSPHVWGRAMGWFAMAHADVLTAMPEDCEFYADIKAQFNKIVTGVLAARGDDKLWHQVLDRPANEENYAESSCSSMFVYTLLRGANLGVIDAACADIARESFDALCDRCVKTEADGYIELHDICKVAGLGGAPYRDGSYEYYVNEVICSGDTKGTAPFIMAAAEMLRK